MMVELDLLSNGNVVVLAKDQTSDRKMRRYVNLQFIRNRAFFFSNQEPEMTTEYSLQILSKD